MRRGPFQKLTALLLTLTLALGLCACGGQGGGGERQPDGWQRFMGGPEL